MQISLTTSLIEHMNAATGQRLSAEAAQPVSGGDINQAYRLQDVDGRDWFLKLNKAGCADMLAAEAAGLKELASAGVIRVPQCMGCGADDQAAWLLLEWLELDNESNSDAALGKALAVMHRRTNTSFGWQFDNYIGTNLQANSVSTSWTEFYREQRLWPQLHLAEKNGAGHVLLDYGFLLAERLDDWFKDYAVVPSLLHGDLWGGNKGALADGSSVIFDPAVYYGDREADLAMTHLFGGFADDFYSAYEAEWPLDPGAENRRELYNLYHVLNHFNMFGGDYEAKADTMLRGLLAA
jgi:protein-ribulosamine 3-kinase